MKRIAILALVLTLVGTGVSFGQQVQQVRQVRPQATRTYRSYSVAPSTRVRDRRATDATWRHADAKPSGQFHSGR
jgi:hypothetical protein